VGRGGVIPVVTISSGDVGRLIDARDATRWDEVLCVGTLAYTGVRRRAAAQLRREDLDLDAG
jgi:hypothetical protein